MLCPSDKGQVAASRGRSSACRILRNPASAHSSPLAIHRCITSSFSFQRFTLPVASRQLRSTFSIRLVLRELTLSVIVSEMHAGLRMRWRVPTDDGCTIEAIISDRSACWAGLGWSAGKAGFLGFAHRCVLAARGIDAVTPLPSSPLASARSQTTPSPSPPWSVPGSGGR
jgi:hypothetical protein